MNVKDYLFIEDFKTDARVGITAEERAHPQTLTLQLKIFLDLKKAGRTDDLHSTLDYAAVTESIKTLLEQKEFLLVEKVAKDIADKILKEKIVMGIEVKVGKKVFSNIASVGACITRAK